MASDAPTEILTTRRHQMFPVLTEAEIARITASGRAALRARRRLFTAGEPSPGMFVVLKGVVAISQRDGLGHVVPIVQQGPGHSSARWPNCRAARAGGRHAEEDVESCWCRPGSCARSSSPKPTSASASCAR